LQHLSGKMLTMDAKANLMRGARSADLFGRIDSFEYAWCMRLNGACSRVWVRRFFAFISRLGDGVFWYSLILLLPVIYGADAFYPALRMAVVAGVGYVMYKYLKSKLVRERPYISLTGIVAGTRALDRYSFPSGHTLHAVSLTTLAVASYPELAWVCAPFAALVAMSRVVLGLHYPTDVAAGALIGSALAFSAMMIAPLG
jgi:undecaprenyl-diphosphatase